jgi:hypothetical protein
MCLVNLVIPLNIIKQHLPETFFYLEIRDMIIDETPTWKRVQDLTIVDWIVIEEEQLFKVNLGTDKKGVQ